jgi:predicted nucleotidyltransferase component of viral defense system
MVYVRKILVHKNIYYELVRCKRNENGEPKDEHLKELGKQTILPQHLKYCNEFFGKLSEIEILKFKKAISKKFERSTKSEIHKFDDLVRYLRNKTQIKEEIIKELLELYLDKNLLFKIETSSEKNEQIKDIEAVDIHQYHIHNGFEIEPVEKVFRLTKILKSLKNKKYFYENIVFYGGTALNFLEKDKIPRLSVDLDFTLISEKKINEEKLFKEIYNILEDEKYDLKKIEKNKTDFGYNLKIFYESLGGRKEKIEIDLNLSPKKSFFPIVENRFCHGFTVVDKFKVRSYCVEEIYGAKMNAVLVRTHPRDLYDIANIPKNVDFGKVKKAFIFDSSNKGTDIVNFDLKKIEKEFEHRLQTGQFERHLNPMLRYKEKVGPKELLRKVKKVMEKMLDLSEDEKILAKQNLKKK